MQCHVCLFFFGAALPPPMFPIKYHFVVHSCTCNVMCINYRAGEPIYFCNVMAIDYSIFISIEKLGFMSAHDCAIMGLDYCAVTSRDSIDVTRSHSDRAVGNKVGDTVGDTVGDKVGD